MTTESQVVIDLEAFSADKTLETRIDHAWLLLANAHTPDERRASWEVLKGLVMQRSPRRVAAMEAKRGLA